MFRKIEDQVYCDCLADRCASSAILCSLKRASDTTHRRVQDAGINAPVHRKYGVDTSKGAVIVVRPDGYVGAVVDLNERGFKAIDAYFAGFLSSA